jgi:CHAD domain-containing protein
MTYRFQLTEPLSEGVRRIADEQIKQAQKALAGDDAARGVHDARKSMKRIRALLRLVRFGIGDKAFKRENRRFRDIGNRLSGTRDAQVMLQTLHELYPQDAEAAAAAPARLVELLEARIAQAHGNGHTETTADLNNHLKGARRAIAKLEMRGEFEVVEAGLAKVYRDCRAAFTDAFEIGTDAAFHEWRKTIQQHWRQMRLLSDAWPELMDLRASAARQISELLGDDHDLAVLAGFVESEAGKAISKRDATAVVRLARARQAELRLRVKPLGTRLLALGESSLTRQIRKSWDTAPAVTTAA